MPDPLLFDLAQGVATLTLNRPAALNALDEKLRVALRDTLLQVADDPEVRAVVITGAGRAFCVGQDLRQRQHWLAHDDGRMMRAGRGEYGPIASAIATMPKPVVAAVNGPAAEAGTALALVCDFRLIADDATLAMGFTKAALATDLGLAWSLPRLVGHAKAVELLMFSSSLSAERALELGLVGRVVLRHDLVRATAEVVRELAEGPTVALAAIKQALAYGSSHGLIETLEVEDQLQARCGATADHRAALEAFVAKRLPTFRGV